jgi:hypothetical protein
MTATTDNREQAQTMQSSDGKTWFPAVPVSPREIGAFGLHYRIMFRVRAFFARFL